MSVSLSIFDTPSVEGSTGGVELWGASALFKVMVGATVTCCTQLDVTRHAKPMSEDRRILIALSSQFCGESLERHLKTIHAESRRLFREDRVHRKQAGEWRSSVSLKLF